MIIVSHHFRLNHRKSIPPRASTREQDTQYMHKDWGCRNADSSGGVRPQNASRHLPKCPALLAVPRDYHVGLMDPTSTRGACSMPPCTRYGRPKRRMEERREWQVGQLINRDHTHGRTRWCSETSLSLEIVVFKSSRMEKCSRRS